MIESVVLERAGLTEGQAKVYLALLELGASTTGPLIEKSGVARSFIYLLLDQLIEKGLVSYVTKDRTKHYQASDPQKLLEYLDQQEQELENTRGEVKNILPQLELLQQINPRLSVRVYEGFKGFQTAFNHYKEKCAEGDAYYCYGMHPVQKEHYHQFWQRHSAQRVEEGVGSFMLFNKGTDPEILKNRNSYGGCDTRYLPSDVVTDAWFLMYKDTTVIFYQDRDLAIEIVSQEIANTFKAYFDEYWKKSVPFTVAPTR